MQDNIKEFNKKTRIVNKDISIYEDEKTGVLFPVNTIRLLARVEYLELDKQQYKVALFQKKVMDLDYMEEKIKRPVPKYEITKREEDKYTITDSEVVVKKVWNVVNELGIYYSFNNKEEALRLAHEINNRIMGLIDENYILV